MVVFRAAAADRLPALARLLPLVVRAVRSEAAARRRPSAPSCSPSGLATIFVFFSASSSKLPGYILPIYPALAILAARALRTSPAAWRRSVLPWSSWLLGLRGDACSSRG